MGVWRSRASRDRKAWAGVAVAGVAGLLALLSGEGCGGKEQPDVPPAVQHVPASRHATPNPAGVSLRGVLLGGWEKQTTHDGYKHTLDFTQMTAVWKFQEADAVDRRFGPKVIGNIDCRYRHDGDHVEVTDSEGRSQSFVCEFVSDDEIALAAETKKPEGRSHVPEAEKNMATSLSGRWRRTFRPALTPTEVTVVQAKSQVTRIGAKLKRLEALQAQAVRERDDIVAKLREIGVERAADLKKSARGQRMAENLAKLAAEIEGIDVQLASIDTELLKARSIVRRMEREQAGISDDEMRDLSGQLREADQRTDSAPRPITPLDVNAALEAAFMTKKSPPREKR